MGVKVLISGKLDHQPIMLLIREKYNHGSNGNRVFQFEDKWTLEEDSEQTI